MTLTNTAKQKNPDTIIRKVLLCDSIGIKFKNRQNYPMTSKKSSSNSEKRVVT